MRRFQMAEEPIRGKPRDRFKSAWLLEKMRSARNDLQAMLAFEHSSGIPVHAQNIDVIAAYNEQGWGFDLVEELVG